MQRKTRELSHRLASTRQLNNLRLQLSSDEGLRASVDVVRVYSRTCNESLRFKLKLKSDKFKFLISRGMGIQELRSRALSKHLLHRGARGT